MIYMARYTQIRNEDGTFSYVEQGGSRAKAAFNGAVFVQPDAHTRSPIDGSLITTRAAMAEHNRRHGVVHESEFGTAKERASFFGRKAAERADVFNNTTHTHHGQRIKQERRDALADAFRRHERR